MTAFSFLHASNLFLDAPLRGVAAQPPAVADALRAATMNAFENLVRLAIEKDVAFVLAAGDIIDAADRNLRAQIRFRDGLAHLAERGIQTFIALGERDPREAWSGAIEWPAGVHIFSGDEVQTVTAARHGADLARISGVSYPKAEEGRPLASLFKAESTPLFRIAMLHCACNGAEAGAVPCTFDELKRAGFDYWALGHLNHYQMLSPAPAIVYPGALQGLSPEATGPRGCCLVHVREGRQAVVEFVPVDAVRFAGAEVSIEGIKSAEALGRLVAEKIDLLRAQGQGRPTVARLQLVGRGPLYYEFNSVPAVQELLERARKVGTAAEPFVWVNEIDPQSQPEVDWERRGRGHDMVGQVLKVAAALREGHAAEALAPVLAPLFEDGQARRALEPLTVGELEAILADAERLCLDNLEKSE